MGQLVCPECGKPQPAPRQVRCRYCGAVASRSFSVCPECGEPLRRDWLRPLCWGALLIAAAAMVLLVVSRVNGGWPDFRPVAAVGTIQAMASDVPVLVDVPTLTPTLTPSVTPRPTHTPTPSPTPSLTPMPTLTPTPTNTSSPTPTATPTATPTRPRPTATATVPAATATPVPTVAPPTLTGPEDGGAFQGASAAIPLRWRSDHTLKADEYYQVTLRYTQGGAEVRLPIYVQATEWYVDKSLYLEADQESQRLYRWSVRLVRKAPGSGGEAEYIVLSPSSSEFSFYWQ